MTYIYTNEHVCVCLCVYTNSRTHPLYEACWNTLPLRTRPPPLLSTNIACLCSREPQKCDEHVCVCACVCKRTNSPFECRPVEHPPSPHLPLPLLSTNIACLCSYICMDTHITTRMPPHTHTTHYSPPQHRSRGRMYRSSGGQG